MKIITFLLLFSLHIFIACTKDKNIIQLPPSDSAIRGEYFLGFSNISASRRFGDGNTTSVYNSGDSCFFTGTFSLQNSFVSPNDVQLYIYRNNIKYDSIATFDLRGVTYGTPMGGGFILRRSEYIPMFRYRIPPLMSGFNYSAGVTVLWNSTTFQSQRFNFIVN